MNGQPLFTDENILHETMNEINDLLSTIIIAAKTVECEAGRKKYELTGSLYLVQKKLNKIMSLPTD
jgi:hypothetical protein